MSVNDWSKDAGSNIGTNRYSTEYARQSKIQPSHIDVVFCSNSLRDMPQSVDKSLDTLAEQLTKHDIQGLIIIGGFEAYHSVIQLSEARDRFEAFRIPLVCIPATISNSVPGTDISLGSDTSLNAIVEVCWWCVCVVVWEGEWDWGGECRHGD